MKGFWALCLLLMTGLAALSQETSKAFVIDPSKPYVYLQFDHIGPRKPIQNGEGRVGLWLRVVNNCRLPIVLQSFGLPQGTPGIGILDEVVENTPMLQIISTLEDARQIQSHERQRKSKHRPVGYSSETTGVARIQPGADILFSVPLNHVDEDWHMEVKFALDLKNSSVASGPFTHLPFYEWDIPKALRTSNVATP